MRAKLKAIFTSSIWRSGIVLAGFILAFAYLALRIYILQTENFDEYRKAVMEQLTTKTEIAAGRGNIYDRNGVMLATDTTVYRIFISPKDISECETENAEQIIAKGLSELLEGVEYEKVMEKAALTHRLDETIKKDVEKEDADRVRAFIEEHGFEDEIHVQPTSKRYYCYDGLASSVLGFTGDQNIGRYGLEVQYDEVLSGTNGFYVTARDSHGIEIPTEYEVYIEPQDGHSLVTTIDRYVQSALEEQLKATYEENGAGERVCGIVMDVNTGEILAMATYPSFNCNTPNVLDQFYLDRIAKSGLVEGTDEYNDFRYAQLLNSWTNKTITDTYMPGSTFKILTTSMCLEEKVVSVGEQFYCRGSYLVPGYSRPISCHKKTGHGSQSFARALQQSCNPAMMEISLRIGSEKFYNYVDALGYLDKTGVDLPGEQDSIFHAPANFNQVELATAAFGQNFNITALQQIRGVAAVANGGYLVTPHVVKEIVDSDGNVVQSFDYGKTRQVISTDVCRTVTEILEEGVATDGGAKNAYVAGYRIAAKTGTTEKIGKFDEQGNESYRIGSTVAYAPAENPQVAVLIVVDEPQNGSVYGSIVAAPYVANVMKTILPYMGVEAEYSDAELAKLSRKVPSYVGWSVNDAVASLDYISLDYEVIGDGDVVTKLVPKAGSEMSRDGKLYVYTGDAQPVSSVTVPDVMGKNATVANVMITNSNLNILITGSTNSQNGSGPVVVSQSPAAGEKVPAGTVVTIELRYLDGTD